MNLDNLASIQHFYPEFLISLFILLIFLIDLVAKKKDKDIIFYYALAGVFLGLFATWISLLVKFHGTLFYRMLYVDQFSLFFKVIFLLSTLFVLLISFHSEEVKHSHIGEYYGLIMTTTLGMMLMASSANLLMAYLALELVSITSYVLSGFLRKNIKSSEAALKYAIYGALASSAMIYGMSLIYGMTGSLFFNDIQEIFKQDGANTFTLFLAMLLCFVGFGYKIASVPFHMWCPDVYEGAPTPITAFLSVGPKVAGFALLIRFFFTTYLIKGDITNWESLTQINWYLLIAVISAITMTLGNLVAINQNNLKRLLAYSSISHSGFMMMGLVTLNIEGLKAILFYIIAYLIMNIGAFWVLVAFSNKGIKEEIDQYKGVGWRSPFLAIMLSIFLFSLTGLPPLAGFIGKFYLFSAVIEKEIYWLAVIGVLNSVIALYYYARIIKKMFLETSDSEEPILVPDLYRYGLIILAGLTILFGIYWAPLIDYATLTIQRF